MRLSRDAKKLAVNVDGVSASVVNALRRSIISDVPSAAFGFDPTCGGGKGEDFMDTLRKCGIVVKRNASPTHNEMLAGRLALVPICVDESQLAALAKDREMWTFAVRVKNDGAQVRLVTTADIQVFDKEGRAVNPAHRDALFPANDITGDHILLTKLPAASKDYAAGEGDPEIDLSALATVGSESSHGHSRWCPVSVCYFTNRVDKKAADTAFAARTPPIPRSQFDALEALRFYYTNEYGEADRFEFRIESECGLRAPFIMYMGFRALLHRVRAFRRALETRDTAKVAIASTSEIAAAKDDPFSKLAVTPRSDTVQNNEDMFNVIVSHEDHTCGNLVQTLIYDRHLRPAKTARAPSDVLYIGYHQPHPLESCIVFRIRMAGGKASKPAVEAFLVSNLTWIEKTLHDYAEEWVAFARMRDPSKAFALEEGSG